MTPCREWRGPLNQHGYGRKWFETASGRVKKYIHRWVVETAGEDQYGTLWDPALVVMHECDNPACFRFDHLRLATRADNQADMKIKGRARGARGTTHSHNKLTESQVLDIYASTETHVELSRRHGVHRSTVGHIRTGRSWAWLTQTKEAQKWD